ncbi:MAG: TraB family protein, partial [uncultured bacterium]
ILAFGHPITIIAGFIAAPFTTLHPLIGVGMVTGLVQAWINKPTVKDFERLSIDVLSFKGFWQNPVSRVLLVYVLSGIGASIGTFVAGSWIFTKVF